MAQTQTAKTIGFAAQSRVSGSMSGALEPVFKNSLGS